MADSAQPSAVREVDVVLVGATGRLGRAVALKLAATADLGNQSSHHPPFRWAAAARHGGRLGVMHTAYGGRGMDGWVAVTFSPDVPEESQLVDLIGRARVVICCAPPHCTLPLVRLCLTAGTHYIDANQMSSFDSQVISHLCSTHLASTSCSTCSTSSSSSSTSSSSTSSSSSSSSSTLSLPILILGAAALPAIRDLGLLRLQHEFFPGRLHKARAAVRLPGFLPDVSGTVWGQLCAFYRHHPAMRLSRALRSPSWHPSMQRYLLPASEPGDGRLVEPRGPPELELAAASWFFCIFFSLFFSLCGVLVVALTPRCLSFLYPAPSDARWHRDFLHPPPEPSLSTYIVASGTPSPWVPSPHGATPREFLLKVRGPGNADARARSGGLYALSAGILHAIALELLAASPPSSLGPDPSSSSPSPSPRLTGLQLPSALGAPLLSRLSEGPSPVLSFQLGCRTEHPILPAQRSPEEDDIFLEDPAEIDQWLR